MREVSPFPQLSWVQTAETVSLETRDALEAGLCGPTQAPVLPDPQPGSGPSTQHPPTLAALIES